ncbi:hypothetical protein I317_00910 [Kwoniella heveanensis CBS 569]|nr:hypothetical protein I317_00910 [Kwoniella heveanensis CBS 569]
MTAQSLSTVVESCRTRRIRQASETLNGGTVSFTAEPTTNLQGLFTYSWFDTNTGKETTGCVSQPGSEIDPHTWNPVSEGSNVYECQDCERQVTVASTTAGETARALAPTCRRYSVQPPQSRNRPLVVLGIESSADDSSASIVTSDRKILSLVTISQHAENSKYGGIHPLAAQSAHVKNVPSAIARCLREAGLKMSDVDAVAYTRGPGMRGCLSIGEMAAKGLAAGTEKRLVGVHHMQAHALTLLLTEPRPPPFPFLILLVSGGHTQLVLAESSDQFKILLDTLDSKIGDAFEKAARVIQLAAHPTRSPGSILESYAASPSLPPFDLSPLPALPIPLSMNTAAQTHAFSFAGILSSLQRVVSRLDLTSTPSEQRELSRIFQDAAVSHLTLKLEQAINYIDPTIRNGLGGLVVSGGVASNLFIRGELKAMLSRTSKGKSGVIGVQKEGIQLFYPPIQLCTDNAAMIAWAAILRLQAGLDSDPYDLPLRPKWSLEDLYDDQPATPNSA